MSGRRVAGIDLPSLPVRRRKISSCWRNGIHGGRGAALLGDLSWPPPAAAATAAGRPAGELGTEITAGGAACRLTPVLMSPVGSEEKAACIALLMDISSVRPPSGWSPERLLMSRTHEEKEGEWQGADPLGPEGLGLGLRRGDSGASRFVKQGKARRAGGCQKGAVVGRVRQRVQPVSRRRLSEAVSSSRIPASAPDEIL